MRLNVNVNGCPNNPFQQPSGFNGAKIAKAAKSSLTFGIISIVPALTSFFVRLCAAVANSFLRAATGGYSDYSLIVTWINVASNLSTIFLVILSTIMAIIGIALYPKASAGKIAQTTDKIGLVLSIVALSLSGIVLLVSLIGLIIPFVPYA